MASFIGPIRSSRIETANPIVKKFSDEKTGATPEDHISISNALPEANEETKSPETKEAMPIVKKEAEEHATSLREKSTRTPDEKETLLDAARDTHFLNPNSTLTLIDESQAVQILPPGVKGTRLEPVFDYIRDGWENLRRSTKSAAALVDDKTPGKGILYVPRGEKAMKDSGLPVREIPDNFDDIKTQGLLYLPNDYIVPGGRFNEMYGWDSYFTTLGLLRDGNTEIAKGMTENFFYEIDKYGRIMNANRTYYLDRSSPPFLSSMVLSVYDQTQDKTWLKKGLEHCIKEYNNVWTGKIDKNGEMDHVTPTGLSRYTSPVKKPCPEVEKGYYEENNLPVDDPDFCQHDRAERESGWDMTDRFGYKTRNYNPVDLNSYLYKYEKDVARMYRTLDGEDSKDAVEWDRKAADRKELVDRYMWDDKKGMFFDYNFKEGKRSDYASLATFAPLWSGLASEEQAEKVVKNLGKFEEPGGLATSAHESGKQWDHPFGWAPLHLIAEKGMRNYGFDRDADRVASKFLSMIVNVFEKEGSILEKYNVVNGSAEASVGYGNQVGFGWTNATFLDLFSRLSPQARAELMKPKGL